MKSFRWFLNSCWLLVVGCWLLVGGCWLLVVGCWLLVKKPNLKQANKKTELFVTLSLSKC
ncbi:hypothetical protein F6U93_11000 [Tamlana haliotis]|uniref:Uncharacterized protein n=1 Tax=Pseudotamlana haliotis TaxID=2614804 RepID=A0A6N6MCH9_9FLAO|nr:hypothetical protein F6U93_11000 [Tamlana haliotis]